MATFVGVGGVNKTVSGISVGVGGAWKAVIKGWVGVGGVWKVFHEVIVGGSVSISDTLVEDLATPPTDGSAAYTLSSSGAGWRTGGASSDFEVSATQVSQTVSGGGTSASGTLATWMNLGTTRAWSTLATSNAANTSIEWIIDLTIRRVSDSVVMDTARITLRAGTVL